METEPRKPRPDKAVGFIVICVAITIVVVALLALLKNGEGDDSSAVATPVEQAGSRLEAAAGNYVEGGYVVVEDEGQSLFIDGDDEYGDGVTVEGTAAILRELDTPASVINRMSRTRALDGTQSATWDGLTATWTYHPDDGLDIVISEG